MVPLKRTNPEWAASVRREESTYSRTLQVAEDSDDIIPSADHTHTHCKQDSKQSISTGRSEEVSEECTCDHTTPLVRAQVFKLYLALPHRARSCLPYYYNVKLHYSHIPAPPRTAQTR